MKQIIRLSLLCAAFAGFSAVFGCDKRTMIVIDNKADKRTNKHNVLIYSLKMDSKQNVTTNISSNNTHVIKNFELPDSVKNVDINPSTSKSTKNLDEDILRRYDKCVKKLNTRDQFDKSSKGRITANYNYLSDDNFSSLVRSVKFNCNPFYYKEYPTSCGQVERGIYHNNGSIFYSVSNGERVTINIILPDGSIATYHFPD